MSYAFYFKKLRKLTLKQISTEHHVSNLRAYIANNIIPKGLLIKLTPQSTGWKSNRFFGTRGLYTLWLFHPSPYSIVPEHCTQSPGSG
jgi:hypothetical protein